MSKPPLCSPPVNRDGFDAWLSLVIRAAQAVGELGHTATTKEDLEFINKRMDELEKGR